MSLIICKWGFLAQGIKEFISQYVDEEARVILSEESCSSLEDTLEMYLEPSELRNPEPEFFIYGLFGKNGDLIRILKQEESYDFGSLISDGTEFVVEISNTGYPTKCVVRVILIFENNTD